MSGNFSDWFTVNKGNKLLVSTVLPTTIARTMPNVLLKFGQTIFYFRMSFNHKQTEKTMTQRFSSEPKMKKA